MFSGPACIASDRLPRPCHRDVILGSGGAAVARVSRRIGNHSPSPTHPRYRRGHRSQDSSATNANGPPGVRAWSTRTAKGRVSHGERINGMTSYCQCNVCKSKVSKVASAASTPKQKELQDHGVTLGGGLPPTLSVIGNLHGNIGGLLPVRAAIGPPQSQSVDAASTHHKANDMCTALLMVFCSHTRQDYESDEEVTSKRHHLVIDLLSDE